MKEGMNSLFSERFQGHESPVDPAIWSGIQEQMAMNSAGTDGVGDLFKERFQSHESMVDPSVWQGISSQLGHGVATSSTIGTMGWAAAGAAVVVIGVMGYFLAKEPSTEVAGEPIVELAVPNTEPIIQAIAGGPEVNKPTANVEGVEPLTTAETLKTVSKERKIAPRAERNSLQNTNIEHAATVDGDPVKQRETIIPLPPETTDASILDRAPEPATSVVNAPEKVESIIRKLTDEVQMEVLTNPARVPVDENAISPIDEGTDDALAVDRSMAVLPKLFMPNTFTPNGDGVNDTYTLAREGYRSMMVRVYAMKNDQLVFSTNNGEAWTGDKCEDGMYMVAVEAVTDDGRTMTEGKVVWLTRVRLN